MVAAMSGGQSFAGATGRAFTGGEKLRFLADGRGDFHRAVAGNHRGDPSPGTACRSTDMLALVMTGDPSDGGRDETLAAGDLRHRPADRLGGDPLYAQLAKGMVKADGQGSGQNG